MGRLRPTRLELISIHLPKTAGWSFRAALDDFDFIGFTEHFEEDFHRLAGRLQWRTTPSVVTANRTPKPPSTVDDAARTAIHEHHAFEVDFYNRALERRAAAL